MNGDPFEGLRRRKDRARRERGPASAAPPIYSYQQMVADDLWLKCPACGGIVFREAFTKAGQVCPLCGRHYRLTARERLEQVVDRGSFVEEDAHLLSQNPLNFSGYTEKQEVLRLETGLADAVLTGRATLLGRPCQLAVMDGRYLMGSMGSVVGEKICRLFDRARRNRLPVITFSVSGGARMQEGIVSLLQMARTANAVARYKEAGGFYLSVLTDPTTGGVTASFASLGDLLIAEPGTLIGFAGRRVIEGTIAEKLPEGFQKAEFLLEHGFLDQIVPREKLRETLGLWLSFVESPRRLSGAATEPLPVRKNPLSASQRLALIHEKGRPVIDDYLPFLFDENWELHGDRAFADDPALYAGLALLDGCGVFVLAHRKGKNVNENSRVNFGMPHPEGYRKARRLMELAERLDRPLICLVDTPGAYCGVGAEERGQGEAIARCLETITRLSVPVEILITGEGGSGGALAIGVGDHLAMLENALYSVISPRGFASLLWKDPTREEEAANTLKITAEDLLDLGVVQSILPEPPADDSEWVVKMAATIGRHLRARLADNSLEGARRLKKRQAQLDRICFFVETASGQAAPAE